MATANWKVWEKDLSAVLKKTVKADRFTIPTPYKPSCTLELDKDVFEKMEKEDGKVHLMEKLRHKAAAAEPDLIKDLTKVLKDLEKAMEKVSNGQEEAPVKKANGEMDKAIQGWAEHVAKEVTDLAKKETKHDLKMKGKSACLGDLAPPKKK